MVSRLLQVRAHLILCFRAEEKIEMVRGADGRMEVRKKQTATGLDGWVPICEKTLPYELTASFLLMAARPGVPIAIKLQEQHKKFFPSDQPITEESGRMLAEWAHGGQHEQATDDPRPDLLRAIKEAKDALAKAPTEAQWAKACMEECGTEKIETADPATLQALLDRLKRAGRR